ncbi:MAG: tyrosine protein kinase, partial [Bacteroidaceae bacterium]|nr:tyrosine protein kinase [Bacteroidaceae bacterium]
FEYLRKKYDYIIVDTAPVGLVSDALIASRVADVVVFVLRLNYAHFDDVKLLNNLVAEGKIENVSVVMNGCERHKAARRGYGKYVGSEDYGYGYGYGYSEESKKKK